MSNKDFRVLFVCKKKGRFLRHLIRSSELGKNARQYA